MKSIEEKKRPQRFAARKAAKAGTRQPAVVGKKTTSTVSPSGPAAKAGSPSSGRHKTARKPVERKNVISGQSDAISLSVSREILEEVRALRAAVLEVSLRRSSAPDADGDLEVEIDSMRRLLSEGMERRTDQLLEELASIRDAISDPKRADPAVGLRLIDDLFDRLGPASSRPGTWISWIPPSTRSWLNETWETCQTGPWWRHCGRGCVVWAAGWFARRGSR
jgi:hypothetical protein